MKRSLFITLLILTASIVYGQQNIIYTQHAFNGLVINPAYAGIHESISLTVLMRNQWAGIEGAPRTSTFSIHSPVFNQKTGLGMSFIHDEMGISENTGVYFAYSYKVPLNQKIHLSLGLQGGFSHYVARYSDISVTDPSFTGQNIDELIPNTGFGIYFSSPNLGIGFSVPQLIQIQKIKDISSEAGISRYYFLSVDYLFDVNPHIKIKPTLLTRIAENIPTEIDLGANIIINETVWIGSSWRSSGSFGGMLELQIAKNLLFGYAYDFASTTDIGKLHTGSHEFLVNYRIKIPASTSTPAQFF